MYASSLGRLWPIHSGVLHFWHRVYPTFMKRKIVQIAACRDPETESLFALCNDGLVCFYDWNKDRWCELAPISKCVKLQARRFRNTTTGELIPGEEYFYPD